MKKAAHIISLTVWYLLIANTTFAYTHADTLRGSNGNGRNWWDAKKYSLSVAFDLEQKSISGSVFMELAVTGIPHDSMQIDLQSPMILDSVLLNNDRVQAVNEGNVWWLKYPFHNWHSGDRKIIQLYYHGTPRTAKHAPWDGGFVWAHDTTGKPWVAVACQGLGASVWWPCKDAQWDEPDNGMDISVAINDASVESRSLMPVMNGRLQGTGFYSGEDSYGRNWKWKIEEPINTYDVSFYIGDFAHWHDTLMGEKGTLDLDYYVLRENEEKAKMQFTVVKQMLHCFEYWMGPYPFYKDGYKLVDAPYLGMEHQSAVAYGNKYKMGYLGTDLSNTGVGMLFDFIIVHESGHEWFGNNITATDIADNWIHEGITTYTETLFTECAFGKDKAYQYIRGQMRSIKNDRPLIGDYGVNSEGSGDIYNKGAALIHMIRVIMNDDKKFRDILRGLNKDFYHGLVSTAQVEKYINQKSSKDFTKLFDQYLRTTNVPQLEYYIKKNKLNYRFTNTITGFSLPVDVTAGSTTKNIKVTGDWQSIPWDAGYNVSFSPDMLITVK